MVSLPERRVLPDGSVVELNEGTEIAVDYTERVRRIALQRGEAHFQVARNEEIPFVVVVGGVEIRAVGTAFSVVAAPAAVEVLVTQGRVAVDKHNGNEELHAEVRANGGAASSNAQASTRVTVGAGNRIVVDSGPDATGSVEPQILPISTAEMDERLAWRVPRIEFSGTPLSEAIPMFNRHSRVRVSLGEPALERLLLSGILRADNVDALVRLLEANYGITAERRENEIVLRKREAARTTP